MTQFTTIIVGRTYTFYAAEYGSDTNAYNHAVQFKVNWNAESITPVQSADGTIIGYAVKV